MRRFGAGLRRLIVLDGAPVIAGVRPGPAGTLRFSAEGVDPARVTGPGSDALRPPGPRALEDAVAAMRFSTGVDDDLAPFRSAFARDPLLGPAIGLGLERRPLRRPDPWEALAWAVTEQLIAYRDAAAIQRRMIRQWGLSVRVGQDTLRCVPAPQAIAGAAPAELQACGLAARRSIALIKVAREIASGRVDPADPAGDARLLAIPEIGPWTIACLAFRGRGEPDALLAGDLGHVKLVGALAGLGRLAEVEEVERFYEPYAPYRGLAGEYLLAHRGAAVSGPGNRARIRRAAWARAA
jgi:3-methyladenine DNA glycosylase/8-oxoguanine DNA glycosylase